MDARRTCVGRAWVARERLAGDDFGGNGGYHLDPFRADPGEGDLVCRCSSVVERILGKAEVMGSNPISGFGRWWIAGGATTALDGARRVGRRVGQLVGAAGF